MAMGSQQIAEDYEQLKDLLELYPHIFIVKTDGQPPDNYEIEYNLRGYVKEEDNTVTIGQTHRVRISLPFGYPHFAPIAKPLTPIFHPDIDPAAIRLSEYWQQNPSLPDLVLHIGEMICGSIYNLEDPFNQEAADWYKRQQKQLPLDSISIADIEETDAALDSLVDDTFASLGLESDDFLAPEKLVDDKDIQHIRDLVAENKIFTANKLLAELPDSAIFPDREDIQQGVGKVLRKTDQLFKLAEQLEDMSKFDEAIEVADNLLAIAADAPGAAALRTRIEQSFQLAQSVGISFKKEERVEKTQAPQETTPPPLPPKSLTKSIEWGKAIPFKPILVVTLTLGLCIASISLYFKDQNTLSQSQASLLKGKLLIDKKQFDSAQETLEGAKAVLSNLSILHFRKSSQEKEINTLITSTEMQEGLKGRVLYQGEYIPTGMASAQEELTVLTDQAQILAGQNKLPESLTLYRQALKFAADRNLGKQQALINEIIQSLELRHTLAVAENAEQNKNWDEAAVAYRKALTLSGNIKTLGTASDITHRMTAATFRHELDQSKKAFNQSQWKETIKYLEQAQQAINVNPNIVTDKERQDLHRLLINSRLYLMLSTAREAYQQKNWPQAIEEYQNALNLLTSEPDSAENMLGESLGKIEKTLLMVQISQIQDLVLVAEGKADASAALAHYKEIQRLIKTSNHQGDPAVKTVLQKISEKMEKQQELLTQNEKTAWLEEHFEEIFRANYPTFKGSKLLQPKANFLKKVGNKMIFSLTCLERSQGSSSKLELSYQFDASTGKWSVNND
ncbi:ubiquitin-conjugating enzyme E2 [uncultured Desulfobulbus sp.]|uniref:ubiquitin-conjugating enzyme E2 n=1 Tax=uncultured Desulfobulbus sp. TaxID=239745 RepID=UPI0029C87C4F|nr:ubiquitin-conjugating enzyme E2 [uncultured Desulfobulbus sp.]